MATFIFVPVHQQLEKVEFRRSSLMEIDFKIWDIRKIRGMKAFPLSQPGFIGIAFKETLC
jgi:hypothetical protein